MVGLHPQYMGKASQNSMRIISNSSIRTSKLVAEYDQVTLGTQESSGVLTHPPTQPSNPDDVENEGAAKVNCSKYSCMHLFICVIRILV